MLTPLAIQALLSAPQLDAHNDYLGYPWSCVARDLGLRSHGSKEKPAYLRVDVERMQRVMRAVALE